MVVTITLALMMTSPSVSTHPEDEFCTVDSGLDPALCAALAAMDSEEVLAEQDQSTVLDSDQQERIRQTFKIDRSWWETLELYLGLGYQHILPKGVDHILFVLALFLASTQLRPLIIQISVFTLAHTITLGLAAAGWVRIPGSVVEPLIALSIAYVAIENLYSREMRPWRPLVVFAFGLFHGLGFASVLLDLGLPSNQFLTALIGFNVGVELGQLTVIIATWLVLHNFFRQPWYRTRMVIPASLAIALTGTWWAIQRTGLIPPT